MLMCQAMKICGQVEIGFARLWVTIMNWVYMVRVTMMCQAMEVFVQVAMNNILAVWGCLGMTTIVMGLAMFVGEHHALGMGGGDWRTPLI